jgi:hypothetical protein
MIWIFNNNINKIDGHNNLAIINSRLKEIYLEIFASYKAISFLNLQNVGCGPKSMIVTVMENKLHGIEVVLLFLGKASCFTGHPAITGSQA